MTISVPNIPELNGLNFYVAFLTVQGSSIATVSNPVLVTIGQYQNKIDDPSNLPTAYYGASAVYSPRFGE